MKPPLWLILHAAAHASMASTDTLFLMVTEPRSGSDWLVDLLDAHPNVCVPAGRWAEKGSGDKHNGIDGHALVGVAKAKTLNASGADVGAAYEAAADYRLAHPLNAGSTAWRCGSLSARLDQHGRVVAESDLRRIPDSRLICAQARLRSTARLTATTLMAMRSSAATT